MNIIRKFAIAALIGVLASGNALAQSGPGGFKGPQPIPGAVLPVIDVTQNGAACNVLTSGSPTDDGATINALLASLGTYGGAVVIPNGRQCRSSVTIIVPPKVELFAYGSSHGNPASLGCSGAGIVVDNAVSPALQNGYLSANGSAYTHDICIGRSGGTPPTVAVGVLNVGYNSHIANVFSYNHAQCFWFESYPSTGLGLGADIVEPYSAKCSDAHIVFDGWGEGKVIGGRFGMDGSGDYNSTTYERYQGGLSGTSAGPNGIQFFGTQENVGGSAAVTHWQEFVCGGAVPGTLPGSGACSASTNAGVDASGFLHVGGHVEGVGTAGIYSDATWVLIRSFRILETEFNDPTTSLFALNAATQIEDWFINGSTLFDTDLTLSPTPQIQSLHIEGNTTTGSISVTSNAAGSTGDIRGNSVGNGIATAGVWSALTIADNSYLSGSLANTATGCVLVYEAQYPPIICTGPSQFIGVSSNTAAATGRLGELLSVNCPNTASDTAGFTNGSAVITTTNTPPVGCVVNFTTSSALPTNFVAGTNYFVVSIVSGTSIQVSATAGGTAITAGSAGTGTQTVVFNAVLTTATVVPVAALVLTGGDWDCSGAGGYLGATGTTNTVQRWGIGSSASSAGTLGQTNATYIAATFATAAAQGIIVGPWQALTSGETVYLNAEPSFAVSTAAGYGQIRCRRTH